MDLDSLLAIEMAEIIDAVPVGGLFSVAPSSDFCSTLELYIPLVLKQRFPEWEQP